MKPAPPAPVNVQEPQVPTALGPDLRYLPADSDLIVHVDVLALRQHKLWSTYEPDVAKVLVPSLACDYAPLRDVTTVDVGFTIKPELHVLVVRGPDRDRTLRCLRASSAARFDGDVVTVTRASGAVDILTFVDAATMVMQRGKQPTKATLIQLVHDGRAPLRTDQNLAAAMKQLPPHAGVTIVSRPSSEEMRTSLKKMGVQFQYFYGSMDVTDQPAVGIQVRFAMVLGTADEAAQLANMMRPQVTSQQIKQMFDRIEVTSQGGTMNMEIGMSEPKLATFVGLFRAMLPSY